MTTSVLKPGNGQLLARGELRGNGQGYQVIGKAVADRIAEVLGLE